MLLIFDDFHLFSEDDAEIFPKFLFHALRECEIPCLVVTETGVDCKKTLALARGSEDNMQINTYKLSSFSSEELAYIVQSIIVGGDTEDCPAIGELKACIHITEAQGNPKTVIQSLLNGRIEVKGKILKVLPCYEQSILFEDERYLMEMECKSQLGSKSSRKNSIQLSRRGSEKDLDVQNELSILKKRVNELETTMNKTLSHEMHPSPIKK